MSATIMSEQRAFNGRALRRGAGRTALVAPGTALLAFLALLPLGAIIWTGFTSSDEAFTTANFAKVLNSGTYTGLLWRTLGVALLVTVISVALGWPAAWALAKYTKPRIRSLVLGLVVVPYITSQLLLIYGFITLVEAGGPLMSLLTAVGLAGPQDSIMYTPAATIAMLVYESIPTAVLVLYSASEQIDDSMLEAARSLGSSHLRTFADVIFPLSSTVLTANFALTYVQTVGAFAEPALLGGTGGQMMGNAIGAQLSSGADQQFAIALSLVLLVASLVVVGLAAGAIGLSKYIRSGAAAGHAPAGPRLLEHCRNLKGQVSS